MCLSENIQMNAVHVGVSRAKCPLGIGVPMVLGISHRACMCYGFNVTVLLCYIFVRMNDTINCWIPSRMMPGTNAAGYIHRYEQMVATLFREIAQTSTILYVVWLNRGSRDRASESQLPHTQNE